MDYKGILFITNVCRFGFVHTWSCYCDKQYKHHHSYRVA